MTIHARPFAGHPGAPLEPTGDPMVDGLGAAAWAVDRADRPDLTVHGEPRIQPMSVVGGFSIPSRDPDPHGMVVVAGDGARVGSVVDVWVDRAEPAIRFYEVELASGAGRRLLPSGFVRVRKKERELHVKAIFGPHFDRVPTTRHRDQITLLEEDRVVAWYAGGYRYAEPSRLDPIF